MKNDKTIGLPFVVWICREWFTIGLATSLPGALLFLYWFHLPESPRYLIWIQSKDKFFWKCQLKYAKCSKCNKSFRWLFSVGRLDESSRILMRIAKFNGREDQLTKVQLDSTLARLYNLQPKNETRTGVWTLFSKKRLAKNTTLLTLCWLVELFSQINVFLRLFERISEYFLTQVHQHCRVLWNNSQHNAHVRKSIC